MQKSNAAEQKGLETTECLTPATEYPAQELPQVILEIFPAIMKFLNQK